MKSIVGAIKIDEGNILFNGKDITENEIYTKKKIGFCQKTILSIKKCM